MTVGGAAQLSAPLGWAGSSRPVFGGQEACTASGVLTKHVLASVPQLASRLLAFAGKLCGGGSCRWNWRWVQFPPTGSLTEKRQLLRSRSGTVDFNFT